ncbi:toxin BrnT [Candidatus Termititenax dinenymphae]|uniref:Toxin BrnT n=1 Tax=Candidatus Termititenax dinenymphae TaxID=2218523 RepID=A0A388TJW6_9BACT|nr:toxin BrnT [Candidatus Termititenax dinenymphae]
MIFDWDENKNLSNIKKHGFSFSVAEYVFADPKAITFPDDRKNYGETRERTIGKVVDTIIVAIIHTNRAGITRIISARRANKKERSAYYGNN